MIYRKTDEGWENTPVQTYKDEPGTWMSVTRRGLMTDSGAGFEVRYFEVAPGGYTSHERHAHEHCVVVLRGRGEVFLDGEWQTVGPEDAVHVAPSQPHQFRNTSGEPFGILCIVDRDRDRPELLEPLF